MASEYVMKDLGYKRTPTKAVYRVVMSNGEVWHVPVQVIADNRDENYADDQEDTIGFILKGSLHISNIEDWASNNMNWDDVKAYAVKFEVDPPECDYEDGWCNGDKEIVGRI